MKTVLIDKGLMLAVILAASCVHEIEQPGLNTGRADISITLECQYPSKSAAIPDEDVVRDLNVWVFDSSGDLAEEYYFDNLSIRSSGSVGFDSSVGGHSRLVVVGNAGRDLQAPGRISERTSVPMSCPTDGSAALLMVGDGSLSMTSSGLKSTIALKRAMSRIGLKTELASSLVAVGGQLGGNVRIREAKLCNSPASVSLLPSDVWGSVRDFKAVFGTPMQGGDRLSTADLSTLQSGGTVYLYSLPNYTDVAYTDSPGNSVEYSTYIEMTIDFDVLGDASNGSVVCRFYANDGSRIGLQGGCSYVCRVILSNEEASNTWRKDDFRFYNPSPFKAGEQKEIMLYSQIHQPSEVSFSLASYPGVMQNSVFRIGEKVSGASMSGVKVTALSAGTGTLYCFDSAGHKMGSVPLSSSYPTISISDKTLDVVGDEVSLGIEGLRDVYLVRESDELYHSLYGVAYIEPRASVSGLYAEDFIYGNTSAKTMYVNKIQWNHGDAHRNWTEAVGKTFPYRVILACGIKADFNVTISNETVGPLEGSTYFGEAFDMSSVDDPLPAIAALGTQSGITAEVTSGVPEEFGRSYSALAEGGWRTWFGGTRFVEGRIADDYITGYSTTLIRWDLPAAAVRSLYGEAVPIFVGKLNPHCNEYVKACVGSYASTYYNPVGVDLYIETLYFSGTTTCLCFRPHSDDVTLDVTAGSFAYQGRDGGPLYSNESAIGTNGYAYSSDGSFLETNWDGDLTATAEFNHGSGPFFGTSQFTYQVVGPYSNVEYGAKGHRHLAIYHYAPYTYSGGHAEIADANGHVNSKGYVSVEKWSVSSKAFFDWDASEFTRPSSSGDP
jgi:hypothetical protein